MEQEEGSSFGPIFGATTQFWSKKEPRKVCTNQLKFRILGTKIRDQTLGQNQPIQSKTQGNILTFIFFISMLKFEANLSVLMLSHVWA